MLDEHESWTKPSSISHIGKLKKVTQKRGKPNRDSYDYLYWYFEVVIDGTLMKKVYNSKSEAIKERNNLHAHVRIYEVVT